MAYDNQGNWKYEDDGVASRVAAITSGNSSVMKQAQTAGMQAANRRGLGNSSIAVGSAQGAVLDRAIPMASQEAQQVHAKNLAAQQTGADFQRQQIQIAAGERERIASSLTDLSGQRFNALSNTLNNDQIPADARSAVQASINDQYNSTLAYLQGLYGVQIQQAQGAVPIQQAGATFPTYSTPTGGVFGLPIAR